MMQQKEQVESKIHQQRRQKLPLQLEDADNDLNNLPILHCTKSSQQSLICHTSSNMWSLLN